MLYDARSDIAYWLYVQAYFARMSGFRMAEAGDIIIVHFDTAKLIAAGGYTVSGRGAAAAPRRW
jgi:hypothetical protein